MVPPQRSLLNFCQRRIVKALKQVGKGYMKFFRELWKPFGYAACGVLVTGWKRSSLHARACSLEEGRKSVNPKSPGYEKGYGNFVTLLKEVNRKTPSKLCWGPQCQCEVPDSWNILPRRSDVLKWHSTGVPAKTAHREPPHSPFSNEIIQPSLDAAPQAMPKKSKLQALGTTLTPVEILHLSDHGKCHQKPHCLLYFTFTS